MGMMDKARSLLGLAVYVSLAGSVFVIAWLLPRDSPGPGHDEFRPLPGLRSPDGSIISIDSDLCSCKNCELQKKTCWSGVGAECSCD